MRPDPPSKGKPTQHMAKNELSSSWVDELVYTYTESMVGQYISLHNFPPPPPKKKKNYTIHGSVNIPYGSPMDLYGV